MRPPEDLVAARQLPEVTERFVRAIADRAASVDAVHCRGGLCSGAAEDICACPCAACEGRRDVLEELLVDVIGAHAAAPLAGVKAHHAAERAEALAFIACRWRAWQSREASAHCLGVSCLKDVESCGCGCTSCLEARASEHCLRTRCLQAEACACACAPCVAPRSRGGARVP